MAAVSTTKMTSKGQIVIPEEIRKKLKLEAGSRFIVLGEKDVVILKSIAQPSIEEFSALISKARQQAKAAGFKKSDISQAIKNVRGKR